MNLGELFFTLGFQSSGQGAAEKYEGTVSNIENAVDKAADVLDDMLHVLEKLAIAWDAMTEGELEAYQANKKLTEATEESNEAGEEQAKTLKESGSLFGVLYGKVEDFVGVVNAKRLALIASTYAFIKFMDKGAQAALTIEQISANTGLAKQELQILGARFEQVGGNAADAMQQAAEFTNAIEDIKLGRGDASPWQMLGIDPRQGSPIELMDRVREKLNQLPAAVGTNFAKAAGLSEKMIFALREMDDLRAIDKDTLISDDESEALKEFAHYSNAVFGQWDRTISKLAAMFVPFANEVMYGLDRISSMISGIINILAPFKSEIEAVFKVLAAGAAVLTARMFPLTATIIALGLAFEDLYSFMKGDDSMIGRTLDYFKDWRGVLQDIAAWLGMVTDSLADLTGSSALKTLSSWFTDKGGAIRAGDSGITPEIEAKARAAEAKRARMKAEGGVQQTNTININGARDPKVVGQETANALRKLTTDASIEQPATGY